MADLFSDGFEGGNLNAWSSAATDGGHMSVEDHAALHGSWGLQCNILDTTAMYVQDDTPNAETRYRFRFYIDPNTLSMLNTGTFNIVKGYATSGAGMFYVSLYYSTILGYKIFAAIRNDAVPFHYIDMATYQITDGPHCVEVDWKASTAPLADNGYLTLWIDGIEKETLSSVDNDTRVIDYVHMGTENSSADISGTFFLDDFASNNDGTLIGLISGVTEKAIAGALTLGGTITKKAGKPLIGTLINTGNLIKSKITNIILSGILFFGAIAEEAAQFYQNVTGSLALTGSIAKNTYHTIMGILSFNGIIIKVKNILLSGVIIFSGIISKISGKSLTGIIDFTGLLIKNISLSLNGISTFTGIVIKQIGTSLTGIITFIGSINISGSFNILLSGVVNFAGTISKLPNKILTGVINFSSSLTKEVSKLLSGILNFIGSIDTGVAQTYYRTIEGILNFTGNITKRTSLSFAGVSTFAGNAIKMMPRSLAGVLPFYDYGGGETWSLDYGQRIKLNTKEAVIDADLTWFPVTVFLKEGNGRTEKVFTELLSDTDFDRCSFTTDDGETQLYAEMELFSVADGKAIYHVSKTGWVLDDGVDTDFYYYYDIDAGHNTTYISNIDTNVKLLTQEPTNPVFPYALGFPPYPGETSMIMEGEQLDVWWGDASSLKLNYTYATDVDCIDFAEPQQVLSDIRFPEIVKVGSTYYLFAHKAADIDGDLFLWSSTNKTTWTIMNGGDPVLTHTTETGIYDRIWNVGVVVVDGVWHMFMECGVTGLHDGVGLAYSYSTLEDMDWDTNRTADYVVLNGGNPCAIYVPDRDSILLLHGLLGITYWDVKASYASMTDDLALSTSWHAGEKLYLNYTGMHTADLNLVVAGATKTHNIIIQFLYNQQSTYQCYSDLSLNGFFDAVKYVAGVWDANYKMVQHMVDVTTSTIKDSTPYGVNGTKLSANNPASATGKVGLGQDFSSDYINLGDTTIVDGLTAYTFEAIVYQDAYLASADFILSKDTATTGHRQLIFCLDTDENNTGKVGVFIWKAGNALVYWYINTGLDLRGGWHHIVGGASVIGGTDTPFIYIDGVSKAVTQGGTLGAILATDANMLIGARTTSYIDGKIDEVRIQDVARSAAWIKATYNSLWDTLLTYGDEEVKGGTTISSGILIKMPKKVLVGALAFTGSLANKIAIGLQGAINFIGNLSTGATQLYHQAVAGVLSLTGNITKATKISLVGAVNYIGNIAKLMTKSLSGTLTFAGSISKAITNIILLAGSLIFTGNITKSIKTILSGVVSFTGNIVKVIATNLAGSLNLAGLAIRKSFISFIGSLDFTGAISKIPNKLLTGLINFSGTTANFIMKILTGVLTFTGILSTGVAQIFHQVIAGVLNLSGAVTKRAIISLTGILNFSGIVIKKAFLNLSGLLNFTGGLTRLINKSINGIIGFSGNLINLIKIILSGVFNLSGKLTSSIAKVLAGTIDFATTLVKRISISLSGVLSFIGSVYTGATRTYYQTITGILNLTGSIFKKTSISLTGIFTFIGIITKLLDRLLTGVLGFSGTVSRLISKLAFGVVSFTGNIFNSIRITLNGIVDFSGNIIKGINKSFAGFLNLSGTIARNIAMALSGVITFAGVISKRISILLSGVVSFFGSVATGLAKLFYQLLSGMISFSGVMVKLPNKALGGSIIFAGNISKLINKVLTGVLDFIGSIIAWLRTTFTKGIISIEANKSVISIATDCSVLSIATNYSSLSVAENKSVVSIDYTDSIISIEGGA